MQSSVHIIFRLIKLRGKGWAGHIAPKGRRKMHAGVFIGNIERKNLGVEKILKYILQIDKVFWTVSSEYRDNWGALVNVVMNLRMP